MIALEEPTRIDNGVANPKEQGQEIISTAIALVIDTSNWLVIIKVTIKQIMACILQAHIMVIIKL